MRTWLKQQTLERHLSCILHALGKEFKHFFFNSQCIRWDYIQISRLRHIKCEVNTEHYLLRACGWNSEPLRGIGYEFVKYIVRMLQQKFHLRRFFKLQYRVSSKSQPQNSNTFQDLFKAFLLNSRPLSTQILSILQKYIYIRDCKIWSIELFPITIHDYDIILSPKRHSDIERGLHLVNNGSSSG